MASPQIAFDKLVYIDRLKSAGIDEPQARGHAEALDQGLRESGATKQDLREEIAKLEHKIEVVEHKIEVLGRDLTIRMGGTALLLFGALASIKFSG